MKTFILDEVYSVECEFKESREGFKHIARLLKDKKVIYNTSKNYLNRTWECFEFESILLKIVDDFIAICDKQKYRKIIKEF